MCQKISNLRFQTTINGWINLGLGNARRFLNLFVLLFLTLSFCSTQQLNAQSKQAELELRRQKLQQQIEAKNQELGKTKKEKSAAIIQLELLQAQIETRELLINNLHEQVSETDRIIDRTEGVIISLNEDRERLRVEYGAMLRRAYKMKLPNNGFIYMLSASNFEESYKKWQYFRQYDKFRKRQARLIIETQEALEAKNELLIQQKKEKENLLGVNEQQKNIISTEKKEKDVLVKGLKSEETRLAGELKSAQKQSVKLNAAIENLIALELESRRRAAEERRRKALTEAERLKKEDKKERKTTASRSEPTETKKLEVITESNEDLALSSDFRSNKGKLPPPALGTIVRDFGKQKVLDKVTAVNNGIDIRTEVGADVRAVFGGTVSVVSSIAGLGTVVLIQHGNYYTVYSNLSNVSIRKGNTVSPRQSIGRAATNTVTNQPEVHFEIWLERTQLNPSVWIAK